MRCSSISSSPHEPRPCECSFGRVTVSRHANVCYVTGAHNPREPHQRRELARRSAPLNVIRRDVSHRRLSFWLRICANKSRVHVHTGTSQNIVRFCPFIIYSAKFREMTASTRAGVFSISLSSLSPYSHPSTCSACSILQYFHL